MTHCQQQGTTKCQHIYWRPGVLLYPFRIFWVPLRKNIKKKKTSWWFQLISPGSGKTEKHLKPPPRREYTAMSFNFKRSTHHADHAGSRPKVTPSKFSMDIAWITKIMVCNRYLLPNNMTSLHIYQLNFRANGHF